MLTADEARKARDEALAKKRRQPMEQAYKTIEGLARQGYSQASLCFDPFRVCKGNKQDSDVLNEFLLELQGGGFTVDMKKDDMGTKYVTVSW